MNRKPLSVEALEARDVPATFGVPWHDPSQLTVSFAPDGTPIAAHTSDLFAGLNRDAATGAWQRAVLEAFQKWAVHANLNFGVRADSGAAFGTPGLAQFDPRFGDIRIGGNAMASEVLAIGSPPDPALSGTWAGDILFNTNYRFDGNPYSLLAVALHEVGHALGLSNSTDPNSVMFTTYDRTRTELSAEDVTRIQALYGVRAADSYEGALNNDARGRASAFRLPAGQYAGETPLVAFGDITSAADRDFYTFTIASDGNDDATDRSVTIRLQTAGASLLAPRLTVYDAAGNVIASRVSTSASGDVLQVQLTNRREGSTYFVRVQAARNDAFAVGRYGLSVRFDNTSSVSDAVIDQLLSGPFSKLDATQIDAFFRAGGDLLVSAEENADTRATATRLSGTAGYAGTRFEALGSITKSEDVDFFRVVAPAAGRVLTATVWTPDGTGFQPEVALYDAAGRKLSARVLANGDGTSTVQFEGATAGAAYFVRVGLGAGATQDKGNYFVSVRFGDTAVRLATFATDTLSAADRTDAHRVYVGEATVFHFVLTAGPAAPGTSVRMTIKNDSGVVVYAVEAAAGSSASASSVLLVPGQYTVTVEVENPSGAPIRYTIQGAITTNPAGPATIDPTLKPQYVAPPPPGSTTAFAYPPAPVSYDPATLYGYVAPADPSTYPLGWAPPRELLTQPWFLLTSDPYLWLTLGY